MSSQLTRIEIYPNQDFPYELQISAIYSWSYGCPELDLMGYSNIKELLIDISKELKKQREKN